MIDIQHAQSKHSHKDVRRDHKQDCMFTYDTFVNPDRDSSIAAIVVKRYANNDNSKTSIDISLVANKSANAIPVTRALWKKHGLTGIEYATYEEVAEGLNHFHVNVPPYLTAIVVGQEDFHQDAETAKAHTEERLAHLVSTFRSTNVLSESIAVCTAFLEAMCEEMPDLRAIYQPSKK